MSKKNKTKPVQTNTASFSMDFKPTPSTQEQLLGSDSTKASPKTPSKTKPVQTNTMDLTPTLSTQKELGSDSTKASAPKTPTKTKPAPTNTAMDVTPTPSTQKQLLGSDSTKASPKMPTNSFTTPVASPSKQGRRPSSDSVIAYVHCLSPSKKNKLETNTCSTLLLQTSSDEHQPALLYSKHKRNLLADSQKSRSPIKLQKLTITPDKTKLIINDATTISTPRPEELSFQFQEPTTESQAPATSISDIKSHFTEFKRITVVGKILQKGKPFVAGGRWNLCTAVVADSTDSICLDLWEDFVSQVREGGTYSISPVQMRSFRGNKKISTVVSTVIKEIEGTDQFDEICLDDSSLEIPTVTSKITRIENIDKLEVYLKCQKCSKKILQASSQFVLHCDYCGQYMRSENCVNDICVKFSFLDSDHNVQVTAFGSSLKAIDTQIVNLDQDQIAEKLLSLTDIYITYDAESKIVESLTF